MPQFEKLLTDVGPDDPPARAARRALKTRLRAVVFYLEQAAAGPAEQVEEIHQLRVWTRRSQAALGLFAPLLPPRKARKLKKTLRRLRQTAGAVRDLDVVQAQLGEALHGPLAERLQEQRQAARKKLRRLIRQWGESGKLKRKIKRLIKRLDARQAQHESNGVTFAPWCRRQLAPLVNEFARRASRGARQSDAALHQWRLAAKRLRYALELAVAALPKRTWSRLYKLLSELQERLGHVCDALIERQRLRQWLAKAKDPDERKVLFGLEAEGRRRLEASKKRFARWWTGSRGKSAQTLFRQTVGAR